MWDETCTTCGTLIDGSPASDPFCDPRCRVQAALPILVPPSQQARGAGVIAAAAILAVRRASHVRRGKRAINLCPIDSSGRIATKRFRGQRLEDVAMSDDGRAFLGWLLKRSGDAIEPRWHNKIRLLLWRKSA